jgi:hypothetical protein
MYFPQPTSYIVGPFIGAPLGAAAAEFGYHGRGRNPCAADGGGGGGLCGATAADEYRAEGPCGDIEEDAEDEEDEEDAGCRTGDSGLKRQSRYASDAQVRARVRVRVSVRGVPVYVCVSLFPLLAPPSIAQPKQALARVAGKRNAQCQWLVRAQTVSSVVVLCVACRLQ